MGVIIRLKAAIADKGWTIKEVSSRCDIPYRTLQNYLLEKREPSLKALSALGTHLGISIDWLLTGEGDMYRDAITRVKEESYLSPRDQGLLDLFHSLDEDAQREIQSAAQEKKRVRDMETQLQELSQKLDRFNSAG